MIILCLILFLFRVEDNTFVIPHHLLGLCQDDSVVVLHDVLGPIDPVVELPGPLDVDVIVHLVFLLFAAEDVTFAVPHHFLGLCSDDSVVVFCDILGPVDLVVDPPSPLGIGIDIIDLLVFLLLLSWLMMLTLALLFAMNSATFFMELRATLL